MCGEGGVDSEIEARSKYGEKQILNMHEEVLVDQRSNSHYFLTEERRRHNEERVFKASEKVISAHALRLATHLLETHSLTDVIQLRLAR